MAGQHPEGDVTRAPTLIGVLMATTLAAMSCLAARLYTRCRILRTPGMDDLILTANMVVFIVPNLVATGVQIKYGLGRHFHHLSEEQTLLWFKWAYIGDAFGIFMPAVPKFGVVVLLDRCLGKYRRTSLRVLYALVTFLLVMTILNICFIFFQCRPFYAPWTAGVEPVCWDPRIVVYFSYLVSAMSAFVDLVLALYPLTFLWKLPMALPRKIGTILIMGLGVVACGCAAVRTSTLGSLSYADDPTWNSAALVLWCGTEANVITICASVPAIMPLLHRMCPRRSPDDVESTTYFTEKPDDNTATTTLTTLTTRSRCAGDPFETRAGLKYIVTAEAGRSDAKLPQGKIMATTEVSVTHDQT